MRLSPARHEAAHFGRRDFPPLSRAGLGGQAGSVAIADAFDEAAYYAEVVRRLWDSRDDDAEIRDVAEQPR